jgi:hypothetical protein
VRDWGLPAEVPLSPQAAKRLSREATVQAFAAAARALAEDWGVAVHGKQVQRWAEALGQRVVDQRRRQLQAMRQGQPPTPAANEDQLLVIEVDGGRVQGRERNEQTGSRWREDKICSISSYLPGDGKEKKPHPLVTTYQATMAPVHGFEPLVRLEAEQRGLRQAGQVLVIADGGNWIDPLLERQFLGYVRIIDWYHASEHLWDCAKAVFADQEKQRKRLGETLERWLWQGQVAKVVARLQQYAEELGPPQEQDGEEHPRRIVANNVGYFTQHQKHMDYPRYCSNGWPIGSGMVEVGIKQFGKRVKGTEQFWHERGVEPILALRALWLSQDDRWDTYWSTRPAYAPAA